jgi:carbon monoxide dehydrogenase subunit G
MATVERTVTTSRPLEDVFAFISDLQNLERFQEGLSEVRVTSGGSPGVGTTATGVRHILGRRVEQTFEVTEYVPNQKFAMKAKGGPLSTENRYTFESADGRTRLKIFFEVRGGLPMMHGGVVKAAEASYDRLQQLLGA